MARKKQLPGISVQSPTGSPLIIRANAALRRHMRKGMDDSWDARESLLREMLEGFGLHLLDGDRVSIGLTSAPFITDRIPDEDNNLPEGARVWWFERYQIDDFTETLRDEGEVAFPWGMVVEYESEAAA